MTIHVLPPAAFFCGCVLIGMGLQQSQWVPLLAGLAIVIIAWSI